MAAIPVHVQGQEQEEEEEAVNRILSRIRSIGRALDTEIKHLKRSLLITNIALTFVAVTQMWLYLTHK